MNDAHAQFCASYEWRAVLRDEILPAIIGANDLGADLLEVGPGYGATTDYLRERVTQVTAVEIHPELAAGLAERFAGTNVEIVEGDATDLAFAADRFSAATSFFMLHHVPTPELQDRLFAEVARVLRPGGLFVAADSVASDDLAAFHEDDVYNPIDPDTLAARLTAAGFAEVEVRSMEPGWAAHAHRPAPSPASS